MISTDVYLGSGRQHQESPTSSSWYNYYLEGCLRRPMEMLARKGRGNEVGRDELAPIAK